MQQRSNNQSLALQSRLQCYGKNFRWLGLLLALSLWSQGLAQDTVPPPAKPSPTQTSTPQQRMPDTVELSSELVALDVAVVDQANHPVSTLKQEDFTVYEDNVRQRISFFSEEEAPASIGLVIDTSRSMAPKLNEVIAAALRLIRESHQEDEFFVVEFKAEAELIQDFTKNIDEIEDALNDLVAHGQTALLDAVYLSVQHAQKHGKHRRKAVVLITDGEERDSYYTEKQIMEALRESDVQVYVIGFTQGLDADRYNIFRGTGKRKLGRREKRARNLLDDLAEVTGGRAFYPESLSQLDPIAQTIARDLRTQHIIGYYPTNAERDSTWRSVRVEVKPDAKGNKRIARARSGYYAAAITGSKKPR
ncbi:MAG: VWA domain-containing protein [Acidobacteria bacterium]|nr:VWA domain-containing protein [Acidobacteriota bacterium]